MSHYLVGIMLCLQAPNPTEPVRPLSPSEQYQALMQSWKEAVQKAEVTAQSKTEAAWLCEEKSRIGFFIGKKAADLARKNPGNPAALEALLWLMGEGRHRDTIGEAIELLRRDFIASPRIGPACERAFTGIYTAPATVDGFLREAFAKNPDRDVRGIARFGLAISLELRAGGIRQMERDPELRLVIERLLNTQENLSTWRSRIPVDLDREATELFEQVVAQFADVNDTNGQSLGDQARKELSRLRDCGVGKLAPEIDGMDIDHQRFRLTDYRGKVVALIFSFSACGPCKAMYGQQRSLVAKLKDKPFVLLSVHDDVDSETLRKAIGNGEITWRCWCDGGTDGPITTRWGIKGFPSIFVLDKSGIIRFTDVRGDELEKAVISLLDQSPAEPVREKEKRGD